MTSWSPGTLKNGENFVAGCNFDTNETFFAGLLYDLFLIYSHIRRSLHLLRNFPHYPEPIPVNPDPLDKIEFPVGGSRELPGPGREEFFSGSAIVFHISFRSLQGSPPICQHRAALQVS
jgi:hypothetical protein